MSKKKVVIIDDEVDLCRLLNTYLSDLNYDVHMAHTLSEGVTLLENVKPDIIFIDNNLPDGLGWDKLNVLSAEFPHSRINLISAYRTPPTSSDLPNVKYLEKPLRLNLLKDYL